MCSEIYLFKSKTKKESFLFKKFISVYVGENYYSYQIYDQ